MTKVKYQAFCSGTCESIMKKAMVGKPLAVKKQVLTDNGVQKDIEIKGTYNPCPDCGYSLFIKPTYERTQCLD